MHEVDFQRSQKRMPPKKSYRRTTTAKKRATSVAANQPSKQQYPRPTMEDVQRVASLSDSAKASTSLEKALCKHFGRLLEQKYAEFLECKTQMDECVGKNFGDSKVIPDFSSS